MPTFEVHFLTDKSKGFPDGYEALGEVETTETAEAVTKLAKEAGVYRVRALPKGDPRLWTWTPGSDPKLIDAT